MLTLRDRVRGSGADRSLLPNYQKMGIVESAILAELVQFCHNHFNTNDIYTKHYPIAQVEHCPMLSRMSPRYQDICLQLLADGHPSDEKNYTLWSQRIQSCPLFYQYIIAHFPKVYRTRINALPPGESLDWHIDTNTSYGCRLYLPLTHDIDDECEFLVRRKKIVTRLKMKRGGVYFINTGYLHKVTNFTKTKRFSLVMGIESGELKWS